MHLASKAAPTKLNSTIETEAETKHTHVLEESKEFSCKVADHEQPKTHPHANTGLQTAWTGNFAMLRLVTRLPPLLLDP